MAVCSFCPLLCEYEPNQSLDCSLRCSMLEQVHCRRSPRERAFKLDNSRILPEAEFARESNDDLIIQAVDWLRDATDIKITGRVVSVDTSRALLALAEKVDAYVDIDGSESAFPHIQAIQRAGMTTASLSEIRFRSDAIVIIGDDRLLEAFPRLPERLLLPPLARSYGRGAGGEGLLVPENAHETSVANRSNKRRIALLGNWSTESLAHFESLGCEVASIAVDVERIPQSLHEWSQLTEDERAQSANCISRWMSEANYLSLVWSANLLNFPQPDLWIERLFQWISTRNETKRCTGFPLSSSYITFQQVCTWITGFPGRVRFRNGEIEYQPTLPPLARSYGRGAGGEGLHGSSFEVEIRIDETIVPSTDDSSSTHRVVHIAPHSNDSSTNRIHLAAGLAGIDYDAELFRTDGTVVLKIEAEPGAAKQNSPAVWLRRLREELSC